MSVSYEGFNKNVLTLRCSAKISEGSPVRIYKSDYVTASSVDEEFHGVACCGDTKYVSVQIKGIVTATYTGTAPTTGYNILSANGGGGVKVSTNGNKFLVLSVDETNRKVTFLM